MWLKWWSSVVVVSLILSNSSVFSVARHFVMQDPPYGKCRTMRTDNTPHTRRVNELIVNINIHLNIDLTSTLDRQNEPANVNL